MRATTKRFFFRRPQSEQGRHGDVRGLIDVYQQYTDVIPYVEQLRRKSELSILAANQGIYHGEYFSAIFTKFQRISAHFSAFLCKVFALNFLKNQRISAHFLHNFRKISGPRIWAISQ